MMTEWLSLKLIEQELSSCNPNCNPEAIKEFIQNLPKQASLITTREAAINVAYTISHLTAAEELATPLLKLLSEKEKSRFRMLTSTAVKEFGLDPNDLMDLIKQGKLTAKKTRGGGRLIDPDELGRLLAKGEIIKRTPIEVISLFTMPGREAAEKLGLEYASFRKLTDDGTISSINQGRGVLIKPEEIERYLKARDTPPIPAAPTNNPDQPTAVPSKPPKNNSEPLPTNPYLKKIVPDRTVSIKLSRHGFLLEDVRDALEVDRNTIGKWITNKVVETVDREGKQYITQRSLTDFLLMQKRTAVTTRKTTGSISI